MGNTFVLSHIYFFSMTLSISGQHQNNGCYVITITMCFWFHLQSCNETTCRVLNLYPCRCVWLRPWWHFQCQGDSRSLYYFEGSFTVAGWRCGCSVNTTICCAVTHVVSCPCHHNSMQHPFHDDYEWYLSLSSVWTSLKFCRCKGISSDTNLSKRLTNRTILAYYTQTSLLRQNHWHAELNRTKPLIPPKASLRSVCLLQACENLLKDRSLLLTGDFLIDTQRIFPKIVVAQESVVILFV